MELQPHVATSRVFVVVPSGKQVQVDELRSGMSLCELEARVEDAGARLTHGETLMCGAHILPEERALEYVHHDSVLRVVPRASAEDLALLGQGAETIVVIDDLPSGVPLTLRTRLLSCVAWLKREVFKAEGIPVEQQRLKWLTPDEENGDDGDELRSDNQHIFTLRRWSGQGGSLAGLVMRLRLVPRLAVHVLFDDDRLLSVYFDTFAGETVRTLKRKIRELVPGWHRLEQRISLLVGSSSSSGATATTKTRLDDETTPLESVDGLTDGATVRVRRVEPREPLMSVYFKDPGKGGVHSVLVHPKDTMREFVAVVHEITGVPEPRIRLIYTGKDIDRPQHKTLEEQSVTKESTIQMVPRMIGC